MNRIATWELWGELNRSERRKIVIAIHAPEPDPESRHGDYRTLVEMQGITKSKYGYGFNSMQSLVIAMQLLRIHLESALHDGWQYYFDADDTDPFDLLHSISTDPGSTDE